MKKIGRQFKISIILISGMMLWVTFSGSCQTLSAGNDEAYKKLRLFSEIIEEIDQNYVDEVDTGELIESAIDGMVQSLDPHSVFMPPEAFEDFQSDTKGTFGGIGIVVTMKEDHLTVISAVEGTPAYKAGVLAGDIITEINGESTRDMKLWEAVKRMRGPIGETLKISISREGEKNPLAFELVRALIPVESVRHITLKNGYGYIWITNFIESTTSDIEKALDILESENGSLKGLVIDLRHNPGGLLSEAISVSDLFLDEGTIVSTKGRDKSQVKNYTATHNEVNRDYPIVLLINGGSASASEIVAGALKDHRRAVILGTTSFGKGSVQTIKHLRDGYGIKYTIARYYTPHGRSIQAHGIEPDIHVPYSIMEPENGKTGEEDYLKEKDLKNHLKAEPEGDINDIEEKKDKKKKSSFNPLDLEKLSKDSQVVRALDFLIGYNVLNDK